MRLVATFALAILALAAPAADAITRTVRVPFFRCEVTVTTSDFSFTANNSGVHLERWGHNSVHSNC